MGDKTKIQWTDATLNPVTGCSKVSEGCRHCYAERLSRRKMHSYDTGLPWTEANAEANVALHWDRLFLPLRWRKPRRVFVNSLSDLFHEQVPDEFIAALFGVMAATPQHTYQILTKRPKRMRAWFEWVLEMDKDNWADVETTPGRLECCWQALVAEVLHHPEGDSGPLHTKYSADPKGSWPLPNVWLGVSAEDQKTADERIPLLLQTPAAVRFVSAEPLLGPLDLGFNDPCDHKRQSHKEVGCWMGLDWVIVGGESGLGARPMHPAWARSIRDQCVTAGVPYFFKQWGEWVQTDGPVNCVDPEQVPYPIFARVGKQAAGRELDGRTWDEMPS